MKFKYENVVWLAFQRTFYSKTRLDRHITIREKSVLIKPQCTVYAQKWLFTKLNVLSTISSNIIFSYSKFTSIHVCHIKCKHTSLKYGCDLLIKSKMTNKTTVTLWNVCILPWTSWLSLYKECSHDQNKRGTN